MALEFPNWLNWKKARARSVMFMQGCRVLILNLGFSVLGRAGINATNLKVDPPSHSEIGNVSSLSRTVYP
jgi:hypothetical protein